jgi:uncharacterized protein
VIVVFDTNILFSAFAFKGGLCDQVFRACLRRCEMATCEHILGELHRHLTGKTELSAAEIQDALEIVRDAGPLVVPAVVPPGACRDPQDLPILGAALAAHADVLVTGDKDLLVLGTFAGIPILSPREFHTRFVADQ